MPKRLIAAAAAAGALMLAAPAGAGAQGISDIDPTCHNGNEGELNLRVDLGPLARVTVRLLCVNEA